jgi:hypothetical protein
VLVVPVHRVGEQRDRGPVLVEAIDEQVERHAGVGVTPAFGLAIGLGVGNLADQQCMAGLHRLVVGQDGEFGPRHYHQSRDEQLGPRRDRHPELLVEPTIVRGDPRQGPMHEVRDPTVAVARRRCQVDAIFPDLGTPAVWHVQFLPRRQQCGPVIQRHGSSGVPVSWV